MNIPKFEEIISVENLLSAWQEFQKGKRNKKDVQEFQLYLMNNIISLHNDLQTKTYTHGEYFAFNISDPKPRNIHKASVRDRLLHHAIYKVLYPYFDSKFIHDSYSCRKWKGTHRAMDRFTVFGRKVSKNYMKQCWILKCDVKKFFASIDHQTLISILKYYKLDDNTLWLLNQIISSFNSGTVGKGLPLGNLTSQLLVNIYMNEFDHYVKHRLKVKHYLRYADDFVLLSADRNYLESILVQMKYFLSENLKLGLHRDKVFIKTLYSGVDFLGWIHFPHHIVLRTITKRRMMKRIVESTKKETLNSYLGLLRHGNAYKLQKSIYVLQSGLGL